MMSYLAAKDEHFQQLCAIDVDFVLFSRAWCVSELAVANAQGIRQILKMHSAWSLEKNQEKLKELKVENMEASRIEDKVDILSCIPDKDEFDANVQHMIFKELLPSWKGFDDMEQMRRVGRIARWVKTGQELGTTHKMMRVSSFKADAGAR